MLRCATCMDLHICESIGKIKTSKACNKWQPNWRVLGKNLYLGYKLLLKIDDLEYALFTRWWNDEVELNVNARRYSTDLRKLFNLVEKDYIDVDTSDNEYMSMFVKQAALIRKQLQTNEMELVFDTYFRLDSGNQKLKVKIISANEEKVELLSKEGVDVSLTYNTVKGLREYSNVPC